jgi:hypothetical protein
MKVIFTCLLLYSANVMAITEQEFVSYVDPAQIDKWEWRLSRAEKALDASDWLKAEKIARTTGEDIIDGARIGHQIDPLLARVSAIRAVAYANLDRPRLARWHWQLAQIVSSGPPALNLDRYGGAAALLREVRPRTEVDESPGVMAFDDAVMPDVTAVKTPMPLYSEETRRAGIEARLTVNVIIGKDGKLSDPYVYHGSDLAVFYYPLLVALSEWEFEPYIYDGQATAISYILTVNFGLKR